MVSIPKPNCQHLDNYRQCRVHSAPRWLSWLFPNMRPACILDRGFPPRDGKLTCPDQEPCPRPAPPQSQSGVMKPRFTPSPAARSLAVNGDPDRAQAVTFVEYAAETTQNELEKIRMIWLREYLLAGV